MVAAAHETRTRWAAHSLRVVVVEHNAIFRERIEVGGWNVRGTVYSVVVPAKIIDDKHDDVGLLLLLGH